MWRALPDLRDDGGAILATGLILLVLLTGLGTYALTQSAIDTTLSAHLKLTKQAFFLADSGLELGRARVLASTAVPPAPAATTQSLNNGSYAVTFPSIFPTIAAFDYAVTVRSVGTLAGASKTLETVVIKSYVLSDGALAIRGNEADSSFSGDAFSIDGRDYDHVTETLTSGAT